MPSPALVNHIPATGQVGQGASSGELNSRRVQAAAHRLAEVSTSLGGGQATLFSNLCLSLARGLDFAIFNDDKPGCIPSLPSVMKLVCLHQKDFARQPAIMVLLFSLKNACGKGWFSSTESEELLALVDQVARNYSTSRDFVADQGSVVSFASQIMSRFYPRLKLGHIFVSLEVKAGFGAHVVDFLVSKCTPRNGNEKIKLLVASKDDIDTSSCLVSPNKVNFLLNGRPVDGRTNVIGQDQGPQPPTIVEPILKYGTNLLQVVGQFDGNCVILVAFMSSMAISELPTPLDYVQAARTVPDSDDLTEGHSRISLLCPISLVRIKTPVKGHMCRHHQCFDLTCYVQINMKRPAWRCPHCNQSVCYTDIRIDQNMLKVLQEFEENIVEVILSEDGSWKAVESTSGHNSSSDGKNSISDQEGAEQREKPSGLSRGHCVIHDITDEDDEIMYSHEPVESKAITLPDRSQTLADSDSLSPNQRQEQFPGSHAQPNPMNVNLQFLSGDNLQIQRSQPSQPIVTADYSVRRPGFPPGNVCRVPNAVQALPAQFSTSNATSYPSVRDNAGTNPPVSTRTPMPLQSSAGGSVSLSDLIQPSYIQSLPPQWLSSQVGTTPVQVPHSGFEDSSRLRALHQMTPSIPRMPPVVSPPPMPQMVRPPPLPQMVSRPSHLRSSQVSSPQRQSTISTGALADHQTMLGSQQSPHRGSSAQQPTSRPMQFVPVQLPGTGSGDQTMLGSQQSPRMGSSAQQPTSRPMQLVSVQLPRTGSGEHGHGSSLGGVQSVTRTEDLLDVQAEQSWRPSGNGRMRGSLRAFSNDQSVILPTHMGGLTPPSSVRPFLNQRQNTVAPHLPPLANRNAMSSRSPDSGI